ncbi:MAG: dihydrolipoamide acetyltransferase family protein [Steroidobacteraceae bacterium]
MADDRIRALTMPKWGIEMQEGTVTAWHVEPGHRVEKGEPLLDVETEKIVNSVESPASGTLRVVIAGPGDTYKVGELIGVLAEPGVGDAEIEAFVRGFRPADTSFERDDAAPAAPAPAAAGPAPSGAAPPAGDGDEPRVSPIARRLAEKLGIDVGQVTGTGRNGRVSKEDVEAYAARLSATPSTPSATAGATATVPLRRVPLTSMRATIARRLGESKQTIPHYRVTTDLDADALVARRKALAAAGVAVSLNDLLIEAVAKALVRHPRVNAQFDGSEVLEFDRADVAIAVATDSGLITPVLRAADSKPVERIAAETRELAERARAGRLTREDITGGTFTVSNLGMYGITAFDAIINPPQVAILAVGAAQARPVVRDGALAVGTRMTVTISSDHRVVDGAVAAAFLATLSELVRGPAA